MIGTVPTGCAILAGAVLLPTVSQGRHFRGSGEESAKSFGRGNSHRVRPAIRQPVAPKVRGKSKVSFSGNASPMVATWTARPPKNKPCVRVGAAQNPAPVAREASGPSLSAASARYYISASSALAAIRSRALWLGSRMSITGDTANRSNLSASPRLPL